MVQVSYFLATGICPVFLTSRPWNPLRSYIVLAIAGSEPSALWKIPAGPAGPAQRLTLN